MPSWLTWLKIHVITYMSPKCTKTCLTYCQSNLVKEHDIVYKYMTSVGLPQRLTLVHFNELNAICMRQCVFSVDSDSWPDCIEVKVFFRNWNRNVHKRGQIVPYIYIGRSYTSLIYSCLLYTTKYWPFWRPEFGELGSGTQMWTCYWRIVSISTIFELSPYHCTADQLSIFMPFIEVETSRPQVRKCGSERSEIHSWLLQIISRSNDLAVRSWIMLQFRHFTTVLTTAENNHGQYKFAILMGL